jgi:succinate dehydrogenase / fumarate reductase iron-sulfur subunit
VNAEAFPSTSGRTAGVSENALELIDGLAFTDLAIELTTNQLDDDCVRSILNGFLADISLGVGLESYWSDLYNDLRSLRNFLWFRHPRLLDPPWRGRRTAGRRDMTTGVEGKRIVARVFRFDPSSGQEPRFDVHEVEVDGPISVMILMRKVHESDSTFACRTSMCLKGVCGSCLVRVNGRDLLGCSTLVYPGDTVTLEPHSGYQHVRDLVVDFARSVRTQPKRRGASDGA